MASLTGLGRLLLAASGLLLLGASSGEHQWNPEHRALWTANAQGRVPAALSGAVSGVVRGPSKRHVGHAAPGRRAWVPGSKMPLHHYPPDRREVRPGEHPDDQPADDALQYLEGADTEVSVRRVAADGAPLQQGSPSTDRRGASGRRGAAARAGHQGANQGANPRRRGEGRRMRHHKQHHQVQPGRAGSTASWPGNVTLLRTVQRGSAVVPLLPGSPMVTVPVHADPSKTQRSLVPAWSRSSPQSPVPANLVAAAEAPYHYQGPSINSRADVPVPGRGRPVPVVPACPADRSVLAPKEQDYVLMEKIAARDGTPLDVIAGPQAGDPVSEGPHPVVGRLVPAPAYGLQARPSTLCRLTYTVIVRRCGPAPPLSAPAGMEPRSPRCVAGTAWGSRCHYRCPRRDLVLRGDKWVVCGDDLRWHGRPPVCTERPGKARVAAAVTPAPLRSCPVPALPEHGHLSCRARDDAEEANDAQRMAEGSECTVSCRPPHRLLADGAESMVTRCSAGRWNVTAWTCVRAQAVDADLDGDIAAVLADAGAALAEDWDWKSNSLTDPCSPNPCLSGGTCLRGPPKARALCQCRPGTEGERCERVLCRGACLHGGRCVLVQGEPSCFCRRGFAGSRCQAPVKNVRYPMPTPAPTPVLTTPVLTTPVLTTPVLTSPVLTTPVLTAAVSTPTTTVAPGSPPVAPQHDPEAPNR